MPPTNTQTVLLLSAGTSVRNMVHWAQGVRLTQPTFQVWLACPLTARLSL